MNRPLQILIVEDSPADAKLLLAELRAAGFEPTWKRVETEADFLAALNDLPDIILSDYSMPQFSGLRAAELLRASGLDIPFILVSGTVGEDVAVEAMRHGASDYLLKDRIARLGSAVERALREAEAKKEHKQAQAELRWKTALLEAQVHSALDGILVVDKHGRKILQNQRMADLWKIPPHIATDQNDAVQLEFVMKQTKHPRLFAVKVGHLYSQPDEISRDEIELIDGTTLDRYSAPVRDQAGNHYGRIWNFRDITERKQLALELRESERRFSDMMGHVQMISLMLDREARITYCNDYLLRLTGWGREEVMGRNWIELFIPPEVRGVKAVFDALLVDDPASSWHHENEILTRSGERRVIQWNNSLLRSVSGEVVGTASIGEDITERKEAEEEIRAQLEELKRWHEAMLGREERVLQLKAEVNALAARQGQPPRYDIPKDG